MEPSAARWVPAGAWLAPGYAEWRPPAILRDPVSCLWTSLTPDKAATAKLVLPDGCSDLIWEQGAGARVAGPDTGPARPRASAGAVIVGVRFRPAAGGQLLGLPLSELRDQHVPLADLLPAQARALSAGLDPARAAELLLNVAGGLVAHATADPAVDQAAVALRDPAARTADIAARVGLSERQLRRRTYAAAGYSPKTLQRVLRFRRFVRMLDASPALPDLAAAAVQAGYADQPHLTRECTALSGLSPAALHPVRRSG